MLANVCDCLSSKTSSDYFANDAPLSLHRKLNEAISSIKRISFCSHPPALSHVSAVEVAGKTCPAVVGNIHRLLNCEGIKRRPRRLYLGKYLLFRELLYRDNRSKDLLLTQLHFRGDPCQDGWPAKWRTSRQEGEWEVLRRLVGKFSHRLCQFYLCLRGCRCWDCYKRYTTN